MVQGTVAVTLMELDGSGFGRAWPLYRDYLTHFGVETGELAALLEGLLEEEWFRFYLARHGAQTVGFCVVTRTYSALSVCRAYALTDLFVREPYRRRGYGTAILEALEAQALADGVGKLFVTADRPSIPFYEGNGWRPFPYVYHAKLIGGAP